MKNLIDDVNKKLLTLYFNTWKRHLPKEDDDETVKKKLRTSITRRKIINLQKKK